MAGKAKSDRKELLIEDARLIFRNFEGKQSQFNREGKREFSVILDPATAGQMAKDGWNIKTLKAREEGDSLPDCRCRVYQLPSDRYFHQLLHRCSDDSQ
jgi:hypothetical protein